MYDYIGAFCEEFAYPSEAKEALLEGYKRLLENKKAGDIYHNYIEMYSEDILMDYNKALVDLENAAELSGVNKYTVALLLLIGLSKHLRKLYKNRGIHYQIYYDSMCDLKWKLFECHRMHNVWGSFVFDWHAGFFRLELFALGRLQFEIIKFKGNYSKNGYSICEGDAVINVHIPSCGPLLHEDCMKSYVQATELFKDSFEKKPIPFVCYSWLLYPSNREILPKNSNIITFMNDFDIIRSSDDEQGSDLWRIFYKDSHKKPEDLPRDTSLQRAYADWLMQGNKVGMGYGIFLFDGENIL
ncbi:MAG: DUF5596 domain-containing protein [Clostridiales bacterium]|nr:DUF5596 domain-containing protein [Clostridiales bacterium]